MKIKWLGHSCFILTSETGTKVLTDPCDPETGYNLCGIETDIVTVSHSHHDHNYVAAVANEPVVIDSIGCYEEKGVKICGILTYHDECCGKMRGENILFKYEIDGIKVVHAGDLGYIPDATTIAEIGAVDVLLVPVGGIYTINATQARIFANMLKPKVVIPMHYKTPALQFELDTADEFVNKAVDCNIHKLNQSEAVLTHENLGNDRVLVLTYE